MPLPAGARLGPFEILAPLGAGGMGEVYRARDTRLDRTVAVKVLPSHLSASPEVRQRFEREARTISQLSHPHICALYDVGREGETEYLVIEYIEGQTLTDRLAKGPLPLDQALRYGIQIADALDRAHRQGIVHRDLKPGNVMLTKSGVKLLDFGLAKAVAPSTQPASVTSLPTAMGGADLTREGTILGTYQYMAPEQLEGKEADARSDIFAFGAVLYEMVTGEKAFRGRSQASLIAAILEHDPPPVSAVRPMAPPALDHLVQTCLAKDPEERWQSANDLMRELTWIAGASSSAAVTGSVAPRGRKRDWVAWGIAGVFLVAALAAGAVGLRSARRASALERPMRYSIVLPEKSSVRAVALSPDGRRLVFVARDAAGRNLLWLRAMDSLAVEPLAGTENPSFPFWAPDNRQIGFFADGKLKKIDTAGAAPQTLCDAPLTRGGTWNHDGVILFSPVPDGSIFRVAASGGVPVAVTRLDPSRGENSHRWPFFLPDGRHFLYTVANFGYSGQREKFGIYVRSLDSNDEKQLVRASSSIAYANPGYLLFFRERNLFAQRFDAKALRITGDPIPVAEQIQWFPQNYSALFTASENGVLLYQNRASSTLSQFVWFDRAGKEVGSLGSPGDQANPRISADGNRIAFDVMDPQTGNNDLWIYESTRGIPTRFTTDPGLDAMPVASPDGSRLVFVSIRRSHSELFLKNSAGSATEEVLLESSSSAAQYPMDWSADGRYILYRAHDPTTNLELWALPMEGDRKPFPFIKTSFGVTQGQFSPDGRWVAYASNESGKWEIYVAPFPGRQGYWKVSSAGGSEPRWRRDGKELFYLAPDGKLMAVEVRPGPTFEAGAAVPLFQTRRREPVSTTDIFSYDVSPDGQRFLVSTSVEDLTAQPLTVVLNWTADLKK